jgi:hypothetical protein
MRDSSDAIAAAARPVAQREMGLFDLDSLKSIGNDNGLLQDLSDLNVQPASFAQATWPEDETGTYSRNSALRFVQGGPAAAGAAGNNDSVAQWWAREKNYGATNRMSLLNPDKSTVGGWIGNAATKAYETVVDGVSDTALFLLEGLASANNLERMGRTPEVRLDSNVGKFLSTDQISFGEKAKIISFGTLKTFGDSLNGDSDAIGGLLGSWAIGSLGARAKFLNDVPTSEISFVDKSWKLKIDGTAQATGNDAAHQIRTYREAINFAKDPQVVSVHIDHGYNRALDLSAKTISPNRRPDVTAIYSDSRVARTEIQSATDNPAILRSRNAALDAQIRANGYTPLPPRVVVPTRSPR